MSQTFKELVAWQKAMELVTEVYRATNSFPSDERFGLTSQIRRSAVSVPSNIAEGQGRNSPGEFLQFLGIAKGSLCELETQILIAKNLGFIGDASVDLLGRTEEVGKIMTGLGKSLRRQKTT